MAASHHGDTPYSGNSVTSVPVTPYTTSVDVNCFENPSFLLSYAPQLAIPGVADWLQETIDETYEWARNGVRKRGFSPDTLEGMADLVDRTGYLVLRDVELVRAKRSAAAGSWVQGDIMGPPVKVYETVDYAGWLVSDTSVWMGDEMRTELVAGIAEWGTWPGWREDSLTGDDVAQLYELLEGDLSDRSTVQHIRDLLAVRLSTTAQILGLDEAGDTLADRLVAAGLVETYSRRIGKRAK